MLIHKELAESNNLKLGDQFVIAMNPQITGGDEEAGKLQETVTIVGIFDSKITQQVSMFSTPGDLINICLFTQYRLIGKHTSFNTL